MNNDKYSDYHFYAKTGDGSTIKMLIDVFCKQLSRLEFNLSKCGIFGQMMNGKDKNNILYDLDLPKDNFDVFHCVPDYFFIGLNSHHFQTQTYSVKKKNTIILHVLKSEPERFYISILPQSNGEQRIKIGFLTIQKVQYKEIPLPLNYMNPILIESTDYHRMCKDISRTQSKKIMLDVGDGWIRFRGDSREITSCEFIFGDKTNDKILFTQTYVCSDMSCIVKASSMSKNKIKIYTGCDFDDDQVIHRPIKITFTAGTLGYLHTYIKCEELTKYELECASDNSSDSESEYSDDD